MSSLTNSLLGRKRVQEFTGVSGVPTTDGGAAALNVKPKPQLRKKDPADKKPLKEEDDSIIPDDAEEVASTGASPVPTEIGAAETGLTGQPGEKEGGKEGNPNLLSTELALVAPDCTPGWDRMLSPSALPKMDRKPEASVSAAPQPPTGEQTKTEGPASAMDALKLVRPGAGKSTDQNVESHARNLVSSVIQEDAPGTSIPLGEEALMGQGKPMPEHVESRTSGKVLKRFNFTGK